MILTVKDTSRLKSDNGFYPVTTIFLVLSTTNNEFLKVWTEILGNILTVSTISGFLFKKFWKLLCLKLKLTLGTILWAIYAVIDVKFINKRVREF